MDYTKLKQRYDKLEDEVFNQLIKKIGKSKVKSKYHDTKAIKVNISDYDELVYIHDRLTFVDRDGYNYFIYENCSLEDLIELLIKLK